MLIRPLGVESSATAKLDPSEFFLVNLPYLGDGKRALIKSVTINLSGQGHARFSWSGKYALKDGREGQVNYSSNYVSPDQVPTVIQVTLFEAARQQILDVEVTK